MERYLSPAQAAAQLGISAKALRIYEQRGMVKPLRTAVGWRAFGPEQMRRAADIVALRALGFSLAQVQRVLDGDAEGLEPALAAHQLVLEERLQDLVGVIDHVRQHRAELQQGVVPTPGALARLAQREAPASFPLPWPWGGEVFEVRPTRALNYIIGPLGSGKTRLAKLLSETLPDAVFLGLDRLDDGGSAVLRRSDADPALGSRVDAALAWLRDEGAAVSDALLVLLRLLEGSGPRVLVVDMIEQGLDRATQEALIAFLRRRSPEGRTLFILTRSSAILDLEAVGPDEAIILCPANHAPPSYVSPWPGAPGYEAVATCLASPEVRARSAGVIAWTPDAAIGA